MEVYEICERLVDDRFNSWDLYLLGIEVWLKKDWFNRNVFIISYIPKNLEFNWINRDIEKDYSIKRILQKYWFDVNDEKIKRKIKRLIDFRKWKLLYL